jgi:phosphopantothenoylcysteine decarboxylase/phosphopantothenate--cysteine ligase
VIATTNATRFIGQITLEALSHNKVQIVDPGLFTDVEAVKHVALAKSADLVAVAPATASFVAKVAAGIADDLLTTTVLTASCPVVLAPAMHSEMWENAATRNNILILKNRGIHVVEPEVGRLTGEDSGIGRLAAPEEIFSAASSLLEKQILTGVRVLVTTGGTREKIDPARFVGNFSSGKQGLAFAKAAKDMGASVRVIAANVEQSLLSAFDYVDVVSAEELEKAVNVALGGFDVLVMAAAVSDYRPTTYSAHKIKRTETGISTQLGLTANVDILAAVTAKIRERKDSAVVIGFAAETGADLANLARKKLFAKGCDFVVANDISSGQVFNSNVNSVVLVSETTTEQYSGSKYEVARGVLSSVSSKVVTKP